MGITGAGNRARRHTAAAPVHAVAIAVVAYFVAVAITAIVQAPASSPQAKKRALAPRTEELAYTVTQMTRHDPGASFFTYVNGGALIQPTSGGPAHAVVPVTEIGPIDADTVSLSPNGELAAVVGDRISPRDHQDAGTQTLWIMRVNGSQPRVITSLPQESDSNVYTYVDNVTWRPDGRQIVYEVTREPDRGRSTSELWQASTNGAPNPQRLSNSWDIDYPAFNPRTGELFAITGRGSSRAIVRVAATGHISPVAHVRGVRAITFSPDGLRVAYLTPHHEATSSFGDPVSAIEVANADFSNASQIVTQTNVDDFAFGEHGRLYYRAEDNTYTNHVYSVHAKPGSRPHRVATAGVDVTSLSVADVPERSLGPIARPPAPITTPATPPPVPAQRPVTDLHDVDWKNLRVPGRACFTRHPIQLYNGGAWIPNRLGNPGNPLNFDTTSRRYITLGLDGPPSYGEDSSESLRAVAIGLMCTNNGGTGDGELQFSVAVYTLESGHPHLLGLITPVHRPKDVHVTILGTPLVTERDVIVPEYVYRLADGTCCPRGRAVSIWSYRGGHLVLTSSVVTGGLPEQPPTLR